MFITEKLDLKLALEIKIPMYVLRFVMAKLTIELHNIGMTINQTTNSITKIDLDFYLSVSSLGQANKWKRLSDFDGNGTRLCSWSKNYTLILDEYPGGRSLKVRLKCYHLTLFWPLKYPFSVVLDFFCESISKL